MTTSEQMYSLTTHGEADWLIAEWKGSRQGEFDFTREVFNLASEAAPEPKPMKAAKREDAQMTLF